MRKTLSKINGKRLLFKAKVERFGSKKNWHGYPERTILFTNLKFADGATVCDHLWFTVGKTIDMLALKEGDFISFEARVGIYTKGYMSYEKHEDYKLNRPTKFKKITEEDYEKS